MSRAGTSPLLARIARGLRPGRVEWIGLRPERRAPVRAVDRAVALEGLGLDGDRRVQGRRGSGRQVTLIAAEHLDVVARLLERGPIDPALLRRNLVVSGINLLALRHQPFRIGEVRLRGTAHCHPCSRMDENLGPGGHGAMLGHGGICAVIEAGGTLRVGDAVVPEGEDTGSA